MRRLMRLIGWGVLATAVLVWAPSAIGDAGSLTSPGPCNVITVFTDTDELQDDIFDNFVIKPHVSIQWVRADRIDTWFENQIHVGNIRCSSTNSNTNVTVINNQQTTTIHRITEAPEEPEPRSEE